MLKKLWTIGLLMSLAASAGAQGSIFGIKGGPTIGLQQWESFERDPLFRYHGILFVESLPADNSYALFAQIGYNPKGSAIRSRNAFGLSGDIFRLPTQAFIFHNASLSVGAKQKFKKSSGEGRTYYMFGLRLDYTFDTNLEEYEELNESYPIYPINDKQLIREINYGLVLGGGIEFPFSEFIGAMLEFSVNPDFSLQYQQPKADVYVNNSFYMGNLSIPERNIRNLTFELTLGMRFLRKVIYVD